MSPYEIVIVCVAGGVLGGAGGLILITLLRITWESGKARTRQPVRTK